MAVPLGDAVGNHGRFIGSSTGEAYRAPLHWSDRHTQSDHALCRLAERASELRRLRC